LFPIKDTNKSSTTPHVTRILIIFNVSIFVLIFLSDLGLINGTIYDLTDSFAMRPYYIIRGQMLYTLFTSMFIHANWLHLIGNMLFLFVFGDNVEDSFTHAGYFVFYFAAGVVASFAQILSSQILTQQPFTPLDAVVGASGAISGVLGAYIVLYPKARVWTFVFAGWPLILPLPAILFLGFWFILQWIYGFFDLAGNVAYWAHIGGFLTGVLMAAVVRPFSKKR